MYYHFPNPLMIDKFIYKCCDIADRYMSWVNKIFESKPKKKK